MESRIAVFGTDTDADLLTYIAMADEDRAGAEAAFGVFYDRHAPWLYWTIRRHMPVSRLLGGEEGIADIVQVTFLRVFEKAGTFNDGGVTDPDRLSRGARAWLGGIAKNLVWDMTRRGTSIPSEDCAPWEEQGETPSLGAVSSELDSPRVALLRPFIEGLSPLDQEILCAAEDHFQPRASAQRLPSGVCRALAERWNTTPENIRQRRHRLYQKIRDLLEHAEPPADGSKP